LDLLISYLFSQENLKKGSTIVEQLQLALKGDFSNLTEGQWPELISLLEKNLLMGLVYSRYRDLLPTSKAPIFRKYWKFQFSISTIYEEECRAIGELAKERGIKPVLLKGMALSETLYEDQGARALSDIDILIKNHEAAALKASLVERGFKEWEQQKWKANSFKKLWLKKNNFSSIVIETHEKLFFSEPEGMKWDTLPSRLDGFQILTPMDTFIHLSGHLGYQHTFSLLFWLMDIHLFLEQGTLDVESETNVQILLEKIKKLRHQNSTQAVLMATQNFFDTSIPFNLSEQLKGWPPILWKKLLNLEFLKDPPSHRSRYYLVKHLLKENLTEAFKYDVLWVWHRISTSKNSL
jgi:hypothetical protein